MESLRLYNNNWTGGYEDEIWDLPTADQMNYWGMRDVSLLAEDAINRGFLKTVKFLAIHKGQSDIFLSTYTENGIEYTFLDKVTKQYPVAMSQMLLTLEMMKSDSIMYRKCDLDMTAERDYDRMKSFCYVLNDRDHCIRSSDTKNLNNFWFNKIDNSAENILLNFFRLIHNLILSYFHTDNNNDNDVDWYMTLQLNYFNDVSFPVTSFTLPFEHMSSHRFLKAYMDIADRSRSLCLFSNENIKVAVTAAWRASGQFYHVLYCLIYMIYLGLITYSNYAYHNHMNNDGVLIAIICVVALLLVSDIVEIYEYRGCYHMSRFRFSFYMSAHVFVLYGTARRLDHVYDIAHTEIMMACASVLVWLNALHLLRPYKYTGPLVHMVHAISYKMIPFFIILAIVMFGFSQAFYLLVNQTGSDDAAHYYLTMGESYLNTFSTLTYGATFETPSDSASDAMIAIEAVYVAAVCIGLLNLLIAYLNDMYADILAKADSVGSYERCRIITSEMWFRSWMSESERAWKKKRWIHFIKKKTDVCDDELRAVDEQSTNTMIRAELDNLHRHQKEECRRLDNKMNLIDYHMQMLEQSRKNDYKSLREMLQSIQNSINANNNK